MGNSVVEYLKRSVRKFKDDLFSKAIYDILKYLIISFVIVYALKAISLLEPIFTYQITLSIWLILVMVILLITIVLICLGVRFHLI